MTDSSNAGSATPAVVVITGAAGDIGLECARRFPNRPLLLTDVVEDALEQAGEILRRDNFDVHTLRCDLTNPEDACRLAAATEDIGALGVLIHAAGVAPPANPKVILAVNFFACIHVLNAFERLASPGVVGICIASLAAYRGFAREFDDALTTPNPDTLVARIQSSGNNANESRLAYAVSKRGVIVHCQARASVWGTRGARLLTVSPGVMTDTAMGAARAQSSMSPANMPRHSKGSKRDIADAVAFLSSANASFITGCDLLVDGGFLANVDTQWPHEDRERWHAVRC